MNEDDKPIGLMTREMFGPVETKPVDKNTPKCPSGCGRYHGSETDGRNCLVKYLFKARGEIVQLQTEIAQLKAGK